jgi:hypothetical protein
MIISIIGLIVAWVASVYVAYTVGFNRAANIFAAASQDLLEQIIRVLVPEFFESPRGKQFNTLLKLAVRQAVREPVIVKTSKSEAPSPELKEAEDLFDQVNNITKEQLKLLQAADTPSKGAAFSKWKNEVGQQILSLETEKDTKLRRILSLGFDPMISVVDANGQKKIRLSEYLDTQAETSASPTGHVVPPPPTQIKPQLRLVKEPLE